MKLLRILLSIAGLFILVCIIAVACLVVFVNPEKMKPVIIEEVMQTTGYQYSDGRQIVLVILPTVGYQD